MKYFFRLSLMLVLWSSQHCYGQPINREIDSTWKILTTQFQRKTSVVTSMVGYLSNSSLDKKQLDKSKAIAADFLKYLDTLTHIDSSSISMIIAKNKNLQQTTTAMLVSLENEPGFKNTQEASGLIVQLEGTENRIHVARKNYNDACKKHNRPDLLFSK